MPELVLSTSAINAYLRCHYRYLLGYVFRLRGQQTMAAAIGQAVHAGVEAYYKGEAQWSARLKNATIQTFPTHLSLARTDQSPSAQNTANNTTRNAPTQEDSKTDGSTALDTVFSGNPTDRHVTNTGSSWNKNLGDRLSEENLFTISTATEQITDQKTSNSGSPISDMVNEQPILSALIAKNHISANAFVALRAAFRHEMASVPTEEQHADPSALADAETMLSVYLREVSPRYRPTLVEVPFSIRVAGVVISGVLDGADPDEKEEVHDTKTTAGKTINGRKPNFSPEYHDLQLSLYDLGYRGLTGKRPKRLVLDVLTRRGTYREYVREPKVGEALDIISVVRDGITREDFEPTGALSGACKWCPYMTRCSYAVTD